MCGKILCILCPLNKCSVCEKIICSECLITCSLCNQIVCKDHLVKCSVCGRIVCPQCIAGAFSTKHFSASESLCVACVSKMGKITRITYEEELKNSEIDRIVQKTQDKMTESKSMCNRSRGLEIPLIH